MRVVAAALDEAGPPDGLDADGAWLKEPSLEEPVCRHECITRISHRHYVASSFGDVVPCQVALEGTRLCALLCVEIEAEIISGLDPWHDTRDVVEIEIATCSQAVHDLLQPGCAALGIRRDDHIRRAWHEAQPRVVALGRNQTPHLRIQ